MDVAIAVAGGELVGFHIDRNAADTLAGDLDMLLNGERRNVHDHHHAVAQCDQRLIACKANIENRRSRDFGSFFNRILLRIQNLNAFEVLPDPERIAGFVQCERVYGCARTRDEFSEIRLFQVPLNYKAIGTCGIKAAARSVRNNCINTVPMTGKSIYFANIHLDSFVANSITMPLVHSEKIEDSSTLLLWKLTETEAELQTALGNGFNQEELDKISHPQKKREWLASRMLIKTLAEQFGINYVGIHKDEHGKAFLIDNDSHISITHTAEFVAVAINPAAAVGIDMEKTDPKLQRTSKKYLSPPEYDHAQDEMDRLCMYWCAKEALYKLYGKKKISFRDSIFISPFQNVDILLRGQLTDEDLIVPSNIYVRWFDGHCLAIAL